MENLIPDNISQYFYPVLIFIFSFAAGLIVEKILVVQLRKFALKTRWKGDDILFESLKGILIIISIGLSFIITSNVLDRSLKGLHSKDINEISAGRTNRLWIPLTNEYLNDYKKFFFGNSGHFLNKYSS